MNQGRKKLLDATSHVYGFLTATVMLPAIVVFFAHGCLIKLLQRDSQKRLRSLVRNVALYSRFALRAMRIEVEIKGDIKPANQNVLFVCNHLSYLDMMVLASVAPSVFVTSIDMGEVFFLGQMAEIGGSLFIERRNRDRVEKDIEQIAQALRDGFDVTLFPEGTSGNGEKVLPFKKSLLIAAKQAGRQIQPLTLTYRSIDSEPFSGKNHDRVCWYGDAKFLAHFFGLLSRRSVTARVEFHAPLLIREKDCRDTLAKWTHQIISDSYGRQMAEVTC
jgi:1-acyl-sn-glycerol-3-phosphate acyltransferase